MDFDTDYPPAPYSEPEPRQERRRLHMVLQGDETTNVRQLQTPPYPDMDSLLLAVTVKECWDEARQNIPIGSAIMHAVVLGWHEGYLAAAGEHARPGGPLTEQDLADLREFVGPEIMAGLEQAALIKQSMIPAARDE